MQDRSSLRSTRMIRWMRALQRRLRNRRDTEHVMYFNRAVGCILQSLHLILVVPGKGVVGTMAMAVGLACTIILFAHLVFGPHRSVRRQTAAMVADTVFINGLMYLGDDRLAFWYPALLWVILGNGFRLGRANLLRAMVIGTVGFAAMLVSTPFWHDHMPLSFGLLVGNVVIPLYVYALLSRLHAAKRQAQEADEAKSRFLASVSHELRTPLHAIVGTASLLEREVLAPRYADMSRTIMVAGGTLIEMVDDILTIARSGVGTPAATISEVDVADLLLGVRSLIAVQAAAKSLAVALHIGYGTPLRVRATERQIREILLNLASNAIKFTKVGGVLIAVQVGARTQDGVRLRFEVIDTGIGIDPAAHTRIFAEFEQADHSIVGRFGGTGLGLAICKRHAATIGGEIGVVSQVGSGATFWLEVECEVVSLPVPPVALTSTRLELLALDVGAGPPLRAALRTLDPDVMETIGCSAATFAGRLVNNHGSQRVLVVPLKEDREAATLLLSTVKSADPSHVPGLVAVGSLPDCGTDSDVRWVAQSWVPDDATENDLAAAVQIAVKLRPGLVEQEALPTRGRMGQATALEPSAMLDSGSERWAGPAMTILVVDDSSVNRKVVAMMLESGGHICRFADSGENALDAMEDDDIDLVFMDVNMPGMDGIEVTKLYRAASLGLKHVPIVALTADVSQEMAQRCQEAGMDDHITKPVRVSEVLEVVRKLAPLAAFLKPDQAASNKPSIEHIPVLDSSSLDSLRLMGGDAFVAELASDFRKDADRLLSEMEQALKVQDLPAFRMSCHALGSAAANMGGVRVRSLSFTMQRMKPAEIGAQGRSEVRRLRREIESLLSALLEGWQEAP